MIRNFLIILFLFIPIISLAQTDLNSKEQVLNAIDPELVKKRDSFIDRIMYRKYKPTYYIQGVEDAKFQIAFNYQIINGYNIFLGYRQLILWDIYDYSSPFFDINMNPELYYQMNFNSKFIESVHFGVWEHVSNGDGNLNSRSIDMSYIRLNLKYKINHWMLRVGLKFYVLYRPGYYSDTINEYMGWWKLKFKLIKKFDRILDDVQLYVDFFAGNKRGFDFKKGGVESGIKLRFKEWDPYIYFQFYRGYGESILVYDKLKTSYRLGFLLNI